jgi:hypothetical protein
MDSSGSAEEPVAALCEHSNEASSSIKVFEQLLASTASSFLLA